MDITLERAKRLTGLAAFRQIPSIYKLADKIVHVLNLFTLEEIKDKDSALLFDQLEQTRCLD